jgi:hypothetical protein
MKSSLAHFVGELLSFFLAPSHHAAAFFSVICEMDAETSSA